METARTTVTEGTPESTVMSAAPGKDPPGSNPCTAGEDCGNVPSISGTVAGVQEVPVNTAGNAREAPGSVMEVPADTSCHSTGKARVTTGEILEVPTQQPAAPTMKRIPSQAALGLKAAVHAPENKYALNLIISTQLFARKAVLHIKSARFSV